MKKLITFCILLTAFNVNAQNPTLEETFSFIKLKTLGKVLWYTNSTEITTTGCEQQYSYYFPRSISVELKDKYLIFKNECKGKNAKLIMNLSLIQSIEEKEGKLIFSSTNSFFEINYSDNSVLPEEKFQARINFGEDASRLNKAFLHLFKLLGIKLITDKF